MTAPTTDQLLTDDEIVRLYVEEGLGSTTIARRPDVDVCWQTVLRRVREAGHEVRDYNPEWTPQEDKVLRRQWGYFSLRDIANELGRGEKAIQIRRKRLGIPPVEKWRHVMLPGRLSEALGIDQKAAARLIQERLPKTRLWMSNRPVPAVYVSEVIAWLKEPANHRWVDPSKVTYEPFREAMASVAGDPDQLLTTDQVAALCYCDYETVMRHISRGTLPAVTSENYWNNRYLIRRCDADRWMETL